MLYFELILSRSKPLVFLLQILVSLLQMAKLGIKLMLYCLLRLLCPLALFA